MNEIGRVAEVHPRDAFLEVMRELRVEFDRARADIAARERALRDALEETTRAMDAGDTGSNLAQDHPLASFVQEARRSLQSRAERWQRRIARHDRNTRFREGLEDSLVVYVLGKVKAGKSAMGNYIAYGKTEPQASNLAKSGAIFFAAAVGNGAVAPRSGRDAQFSVGAMETTREIQGFRMEGLTWVDSPGLHSVTSENGALASSRLLKFPLATGPGS